MATYSGLGKTTGNNIRIRKTPSTSGDPVKEIPNSGTLVLTDGDKSSGSGYTWYYLSCKVNGTWQTGYCVSNYIALIEEEVKLSSNGYSAGSTLNLSWSSVYSDYVTVSYSLTDSFGNSFSSSGKSCTIDLSKYYTVGDRITFTLTTSYSYSTGTTAVQFSKSSIKTYCTITYNGPSVTTPSKPNVSLSGDTFFVTWNACTGTNGSGNVSYRVIYGDTVNGATAYTSSVTTATSLSIAKWISATDSDIDCSFCVEAMYSGAVSKQSQTTVYVIYTPRFTVNPGNPVVAQSGTQYVISWTPAEAKYGAETDVITYDVLYDDDSWNAGSSTSLTHNIPEDGYGKEIGFAIRAKYAGQYAWSETTVFKAVRQNAHYSIRCYFDGKWQDCLVYVHDGTSFVESVPYYYDGTSWTICSF